MKLAGLPASAGGVVAPVIMLREGQGDAEPLSDPVVALRQAALELEELARANAGVLSEVLEAQAMMAADPEVVEGLGELAAELEPAEAIQAVFAAYKDALSGARSEYQRARVHDIESIESRALAVLAGRRDVILDPPIPGVLVAASISPGDTGRVPDSKLLGIVSGDGGPLSHAAIVSRALGVPAVLALGSQIDVLRPGQWIAVDGDRGEVEVLERPPSDIRIEPRPLRGQEADDRRGRTADGAPITLLANIGGPADVSEAVRLGADGCGLLRTEFLFADRPELPGVDEQVGTYDELIAPLEGPVIVRALDGGADKPVAFLDQPPEPNPALGVRGVRLLLEHPDLLRDQARALCRCQYANRIHFMLPMVTRAAELRAARSLVGSVFAEEGQCLKLGAMVEVPLAAIGIAELVEECDFVSLGTNDLFQYLFAADRSQDLGSLIEPLPLAVWQLLARVLSEAKAAGIPAGVCGELAGDDPGGGILWALGAQSLSVSPNRLPKLKDLLASRSADEWRELAMSQLDSAAEDQHV